MSDALHHDNGRELWQPPQTFRETIAAAEHVAALLVEQLAGQIVVPVNEVEFLARRLHRLARGAHLALPPDVT